ncbi:hypothetical protein BYT27DRAFT_7281969 [Phlegmacium glaucopus]|nr:hypothetical protein BYT27DRAFT_7281969 [Phlegmacium glaucopus]
MPAMPQVSSIPVLNPSIYLNYLSPEMAEQFELARNVSLVTLGALLCDILVALPEDLAIIKSGIGPTMIAYILSRVSGLVYVILCVVSKTSPGSHCAAYQLGIGLCWVVATASFSFLFLRRAQAVFYHRKFWRYFYSCLFLVNVGVSVVVPIGNRAGPLGQTGWCINTMIAPYVSAAVLSRLLFDSCVFLGISYELATRESIDGASVTWRTFVTGKVPTRTRLARALVRGGQQYYLISVCSNLAMSSLIIASPHIPLIYEVMFTVPDIALSTSMACRVFRNLRTSATHTDIITSTMSILEFPPTEISDSQSTASLGVDVLPRSQSRQSK